MGKRRGRQRITVVFRAPTQDSGTLANHYELFQYGDGHATAGPEEQPEPRCSQICDMAAPPPDSLLSTDRQVIFSRSPQDTTSGWARGLRFGFALQATVSGKLLGTPEVTCTTGTISTPQVHHQYLGYGQQPTAGPLPPLRDHFAATFDPRPADGSGRLRAGDHQCTVRYRLDQGGRQIVIEGQLPIRIEPNGMVHVGTGRGAWLEPARRRGPASRLAEATVPHPTLPLPLRYAVHVGIRERRGEGVLLGVECPAAHLLGSPTYLWSASAGDIEPQGDGSSALWIPPVDAASAVAICAVQALPYDLQIGSYRLAAG